MNFFRLVLLISLSFGVGVSSSYAEVLAKSEIPETKEIVDTNYLINRGLKVQKSSNFGIDSTSSKNPVDQSKNKPQSTPCLPVKRHVWVMQFLL